jgi:DNA-directed RNA polymerase specialized sigma24 family protein
MLVIPVVQPCQRVGSNQAAQSEEEFERFRRAFDDQDEEAQEAIYHQYKILVFAWIHRVSGSYSLSQLDIEEIANQAIFKLFNHLKKVSIADNYEHVAQLLAYCRRCVKTTAIDFMRRNAPKPQETQLSMSNFCSPSPEHEVLRQALCQQIRELVDKHVIDAQERRYLELKFVHGYTPKEIVTHFPDEFRDRRTLYKLWDRIKKRLKPLCEIYFNNES